MKRELLGLCTVATFVGAPAALAVDCEVTLFVDCFENYVADDFVIGQDCGVSGGCGDPSPTTCVDGNRWSSWDDSGAPINEGMVVNGIGGGDNSLSVDGTGAPATAEDTVMQVGGLFPGGLEAGKAYSIKADVYIPAAYNNAGCNNFYILLNTYFGTKNWSTQVHFDAASGDILSDFDDGVQNSVSYQVDTWALLETIIVVDSDTQIISYDGAEVVTKSWIDGVSGGGAMDLAAWDLYANDCADGDGVVYYDNLTICEIDPVGACCHDDGSCDEGTLEADCIASGDRGGDPDGFFLGIGSTCDCDVRGENGWVVDAPIVWDGSGNRGMGSFNGDCSIFGGDDDEWVVTIPWTQEWFFNACDFGGADGVMTVGTTACDDDLGFNDDNPIECGAGSLASALRTEIEGTATTVYVLLENPDGADPDFTLAISAQCPRLAATPGAIPEDEPCGEDTNGGCNMEGTPVFIPIECGDTIRGTMWNDGATRDTDWYVLDLKETTDITITGNSVFAGAVFGVIQDSEQQDCEVVQFITPLDTTGGCQAPNREAVVNTTLEGPNTWWLFSAPSFGGPVRACSVEDPDGQNGFTFNLECGAGQPCPWDFDESGDVGFNDLVTLLANWGPCEDPNDCPWDFDDNDDVGFNDLVTLLANWGPCP